MEGPQEAKNLNIGDKGKNNDTFPCDLCNYFCASQQVLKRHMEAKHEGIRYPCDQCEYSATQISHLKRHKKGKHEGIRYPCDQCEYTATRISLLKEHKKAKHEGIRYPCDLCEYSATQMSNLKKHKEARHEGIRYPCDQCEYSATEMSKLKKHKEAKHEGIRYPCDQCEYRGTRMDDLKRHKKTKHDGIRYSKKFKHEKFEYTAMQLGNIEVHHQKEISPVTMKDNVIVEKLAISKNQDFIEYVLEPEFIEVSEMHEVDKEIKTEMDIDPLSIIDYYDSENNTTMVEINKGNAMNKDCEAKIEPDIDLVVKTEPSDISELID